ncbi:MAG: hydantoinase/oxoprolinase family protein [Paracoccaceae bacterium]
MTGRYVIGVDVGGTFTDIFVWNEANGIVRTGKVPSTHEDQSRGFIDGISAQIADLANIATVIHGTTVGTNALLERKGAKTGLITSAGFGDVLEMRRRDRPKTWGLWGQFEPVIRRDLRWEIPERTHADGTVHTAIDPETAKNAAAILRNAGCEAVCIFFVNSYANAANEAAAGEAVRSIWPNQYVTVSTEIIPEIREFERVSTASLNAYLQPVVSSYLDRVEEALAAEGSGGDLLIVQSNGGVMAVETAKRFPVRTALSGPAAGVIAARAIARAAGFENVITCDMGGTSFDVSLIAGGEAALAAQTAIDFGMVVRTPMIEITTIGAGGGSIAWVDAGGILQVGPESAGSNPGPACYGQGNDRPTVTDANLVLGRINAGRPIGGKLDRLDAEAAREAIRVHVAAPLDLDVMDAAEAVLKVANARMAGSIRLVSIERGHDPAKFAAMPFGGSGALHAGALMHDVGLGWALVPRFPGVTSALGCVVADMRHDRVQTVNRPLAQLDCPALEAEMRAEADRTEALLARAGVGFERIDRRFEFDMLYLGQTHTVAVPLEMTAPLTRERIQQAFDSAYLAAYGRLLEAIPVRVLNYRVAVTGRRPHFDMSVFSPPAGGTLESCRRGERIIRVDGADLTAPVYERLDLPEGVVIPGPAILEQADSTVFIDPGLAGRIDRHGNVVIAREGAHATD